MTRWSLCGLIIHLANKALDYGQRAIKSEKDFRSLHFSDATYFPGPFKLPYPVQRLVVDELKEGNLLLEEEKEGREIKDGITCDCLFWQKYQLPCRHLWLSHHIFDLGFREETAWIPFVRMWEESGYEIYEGMTMLKSGTPFPPCGV